MNPREEERFLELARKKGVLRRQLESFAAIKAQREGRTLGDVLSGSLPADAVAAIRAEVAELAFRCGSCGGLDWAELGAPAPETCIWCEEGTERPPEEKAHAEPVATPQPAAAGDEEVLDDFLAGAPMTDLAAFEAKHDAVFFYREVPEEGPRIVRLAPGAGEALGVTVEREPAGGYVLVVGSGEVAIDSRLLDPGRRVRVDEGRLVRLGRTRVYRAFTPRGFFRFLAFLGKLERARRARGD